jgi:chromosomal replication initiation ATPase DnaA
MEYIENKKNIDHDKIILIINLASDYFKHDILDSKNLKCRKRHLIEGRSITYKLICSNTNLAYEKVGSYFGKGHATILHSLRLFNNYSETERVFASDYIKLRNIVNYALLKEKDDLVKDITNESLNIIIENRDKKIEDLKEQIEGLNKKICELKLNNSILNVYVDEYNKLIAS